MEKIGSIWVFGSLDWRFGYLSWQVLQDNFNGFSWFFHGDEMSGAGNKPVSAVLKLRGGFLEIDKGTIGALFSLYHPYRTGNLGSMGQGL